MTITIAVKTYQYISWRKMPKKLALTIAHNKPSHTQHVKISLYILSLQIVVLCQNQYN